MQRTRKELEAARQPKMGLEKANYSMSDTKGGGIDYGDMIPVKISDGETYEQQILEAILDIRDLLASNQE